MAEGTTSLDKAVLFAELRRGMAEDLDGMSASHKQIIDGATHAESRAENDKDTRAIESTYLARGLAERVVALEQAVVRLDTLKVRAFGEDDPIALSAVVTLRDEQNESLSYYLLSPTGAGRRLEWQGAKVSVITTSSPMGQALLGKYCDDDVDVRTPEGVRPMSVIAVA